MKDKKELSICISSYNNKDWIYELIIHILQCQDNRFEVVISDNCSSDGTYEKLKTIKDERLMLYQNEKNLGPTANYMNAIWHATGKIALFMIDKDLIMEKNIPNFIDLISKQNFSVGYCLYGYRGTGKFQKIYPKGEEALFKLAYLMYHPTGYIYNREQLNHIKPQSWYSEVENVGVFPFEFLNADLACIGNGIEIQLALCYPRKVNKNKKIQRSLTYSKKNNNLFFEPSKRLEILKMCLKHIGNLKTNPSIKNKLSAKVLISLCLLATFGYREVLNDPIRCEHYGINTKEVKFIEILNTTFIFLRTYVNMVNIDFWSKIKIILKTFFTIFDKEIRTVLKCERM